MKAHPVLDAHVHCGRQLPYPEIAGEWQRAGIAGGVAFSPVEEVYDRFDPFFRDSPPYRKSRAAVHEYLLQLGREEKVFPYFFVWNDFAPVPEGFLGIKWHRHPDEPVYEYESPQCEERLEQIISKRLPIVLEEEFVNTVRFVERIADRTVIIIPHLGALNGGYGRLRDEGIFERDTVWADTALAGPREMEDYARRHGTDRLLFGSDFPFGIPANERERVESVFGGTEGNAVLGGNLLRLLGKQES